MTGMGGSGAASTQGSHKPLWKRTFRCLAGLKRHKSLAVLGIGVALSAASTVANVAHVTWPWIVVLGCGITAVAALATNALEARKPKGKLRNLWGAFGIVVVLLVGIFCYHRWWDPANAAGVNFNGYQVIVNGTDLQSMQPYDQPGGSQTFEYQPLYSDMPVSLACYVFLPNSGFWYEVYGNNRGWVRRDAVHTIPGTSFPSPPHC